MKINVQLGNPNRHVLSLSKSIARRFEEEVGRDPMVNDETLIEIVEELVSDKINIVRIVGRKDTNKEGIIKDIEQTCGKIKNEVKNRFRKKPLHGTDLVESGSGG